MQINSDSNIQLKSSFTEHAKVVEMINSLNLSWKAENYEQFSGMTIEDLNKFTGRKSSIRDIAPSKKSTSLLKVGANKPLPHETSLKKKISKRKMKIAGDMTNMMRFKEEEVGSIFESLSFSGKIQRKRKFLEEQKAGEKNNEKAQDSGDKDSTFKDLPKDYLIWKDKCSPAESQVNQFNKN